MVLANMGIKRPKLVSFGRKEKREEEEDGGAKIKQSKKVWKLNLSMDLWNFKGLVWLIACLQKLGFR